MLRFNVLISKVWKSCLYLILSFILAFLKLLRIDIIPINNKNLGDFFLNLEYSLATSTFRKKILIRITDKDFDNDLVTKFVNYFSISTPKFFREVMERIMIVLPSSSIRSRLFNEKRTLGHYWTEDGQSKYWDNKTPSISMITNSTPDSQITLPLYKGNQDTVILHIRDNFYKTSQLLSRGVSPDEIKSIQRKHQSRNADPNSYIPTIKFLINQGYHVMRIGHSNLPLDYESPDFTDFSRNNNLAQSQILSLLSSASLFIGEISGPFFAAHWSKVPSILVNFIDLRVIAWGMAVKPKVVCALPKVFLYESNPITNWNNHMEKFLLNSGEDLYNLFDSSGPYQALANSSEDILGAVREFLDHRHSIFSSNNQAHTNFHENFLKLSGLHNSKMPYMSGYWRNFAS